MKTSPSFEDASTQLTDYHRPDAQPSSTADHLATRLRSVSQKLVTSFNEREDILSADTDFKSALSLFTELRSSLTQAPDDQHPTNVESCLTALTAFLHACALMEATSDLLDDVE